jgi:enoyl-[acyl-carrier protein] reductase I
MIEAGKTYLVMGLLDPDSIAYAIGSAIVRHGGHVIYSIQNELLKRRYLDSSKKLTAVEKAGLDLRYCDVSAEEEVRRLFENIGPLAGVVHSLAYANPATCLGEEFHTDAIIDIQKSYHVSCISLATVARHAAPHIHGGSLVTLSFDTSHAYALYNWMGVHKAALEALVRALARRHGRDLIRVNAVSAGPLATTASSKIPGFDHLQAMWRESSPLPWDPVRDKQAVADAVLFLLGPHARMITGQVLAVDGGAAIIGGRLMDHERSV